MLVNPCKTYPKPEQTWINSYCPIAYLTPQNYIKYSPSSGYHFRPIFPPQKQEMAM